MTARSILRHALLVGTLAALLVAPACSRNLAPPGTQDGGQPTGQTQPSSTGATAARTQDSGSVPATGPMHAAAGVRWRAPASWGVAPDRPMRVATYRIQAASTGSEGAECAVFFFGSGQGGDIESNIARWQGQFEPENGRPAEAITRSVTSATPGIDITRVDISGTYLFSPAPMSPQKTPKPGYRMLGAIVSAPAGNVFFKLIGPAATVAASEEDFEALLSSLERE